MINNIECIWKVYYDYEYYSYPDQPDEIYFWGINDMCANRYNILNDSVFVSTDQKEGCPPGFHWDDMAGECLNDTSNCPYGSHWDDMQMTCVPDMPMDRFYSYEIQPDSLAIIQLFNDGTFAIGTGPAPEQIDYFISEGNYDDMTKPDTIIFDGFSGSCATSYAEFEAYFLRLLPEVFPE